jgi:hypothetical protein
MNTVNVCLVAYGPYVLTFQSGANDFLTNVLIAIEKLEGMGHSFTVNDMGHRFFINVR